MSATLCHMTPYPSDTLLIFFYSGIFLQRTIWTHTNAANIRVIWEWCYFSFRLYDGSLQFLHIHPCHITPNIIHHMTPYLPNTKYFYKNIGGEHFSNLGCFSSHQKIFMKYHHEMWKIPICLLILENSSPALVVFSLADLTGWQGTAIGRSNGQTKSDGSWLGQGAAGPGAQTTLARWCPGSPRRPFAGWPRSPDNTSSWDPNPWVVPCQGKTGRRSRLRRYKHTNTTSAFSPNMKNTQHIWDKVAILRF